MSKKGKFIFLGIFVVAASIAFNFSGIEDYGKYLGTKNYQVAVEQYSENAIEAIDETRDEPGEII